MPLNVTVFAAAPPPGVTFRVADLLPAEVGLNRTETVHFPPAETWAGQLLVRVYCPGAEPASVTDAIGKATVLVLVTETVLAALAVPLATLPNARFDGATVYE